MNSYRPSPESRQEMGRRLIQIRSDLYSVGGAGELAQHLGVPTRTWTNYEAGVTVPAEIILMLVCRIGVKPHWLLTGKGRKYARLLARPSFDSPVVDGAIPDPDPQLERNA